MTEQLDIFGVFDAANEGKKKTEPKKAKVVAKAAPKPETKKEKKKELAPTWELHFFDADKAQRIAWYRAKTKDEAEVKLIREYKQSQCYFITESKRTLEEIESLD